MNSYFNNTNKFIDKCKEIHGDFYDYSIVNYISYNIQVDIICPIHGIFKQKPTDHKDKKRGCQKCGLDKANFNKNTTQSFIDKSNIKHTNKYDYSITKYKTIRKHVDIICPIHGKFQQVASTHLKGSGCKICKSSKGELKIFSILNNNTIKNIREYKFDGCINKNKLPFDFYLPDFNICIEYDGEMHFKEIERFGGKAKLDYHLKNDNIKNNFCINNNIRLFRIKYDQDIDIEMIKIIDYLWQK
jgi:uncharacterized Zn finger protein (UPF0148 family)